MAKLEAVTVVAQKILVTRTGKAESDILKTKYKDKTVSSMKASEIAEIVQLLAIAAGIADKDGKIK